MKTNRINFDTMKRPSVNHNYDFFLDNFEKACARFPAVRHIGIPDHYCSNDTIASKY